MSGLWGAVRYSSSIQKNILKCNIRRITAVRVPITTSTVDHDPSHITKPTIRPCLFSRNKIHKVENYSDVPLDAFPNPLFNMNKEEILRLSQDEYSHLAQIPYKSISETDKLCLNIIDIVNEKIISDTKTAAYLLKCIKDKEMTSIILSTLRQFYSNDRVKRSILEYMISPTSKEFRDKFFENVSYILNVHDKSSNERSEILLNYLKTLTSVNNVNDKPLLLKTEFYQKIIKLIPSSRFAELYSYFLNINIQTYAMSELELLKKRLVQGSNLDKFIARTGWINPRWHDVERFTFDSIHEQKMLNFFSVTDLKVFTLFFINKNDAVNANLYLRLLVSKFEQKCSQLVDSSQNARSNDTSINEDVQSVVNVILNHVMVFKGSKNCIKILKYLVKNNLEIHFETLLIIMKNLRLQGYYQEALLIMNNISLDKINHSEGLKLIEEILILIKSKYPTSPKILIGYTASIFNGTGEHNSGLELLNDLNLLAISHGNGQIGRVSSFDTIQRANIDTKLTGFEFTSAALTSVYDIILKSLPKSLITPEFISNLYHSYIKKINNSKTNQALDVFHENKLNDHIMTTFIKYLLKEDPASNDMNLIKSSANFEIAKAIVNDFHEKVRIKRTNRTVYLYDLLVYSSLITHQDYQFASSIMRFSRSNGLPFSFNQIYPFIMYHYSRKEYDNAKLWYDQMVKNGVKATALPAKNLFKIARELHWKVNGFTYRKFNIYKNHKKREEMIKLHRDPILFIENSDTEDEITEELFNSTNDQSDFNFGDELAAILYKANQMKQISYE